MSPTTHLELHLAPLLQSKSEQGGLVVKSTSGNAARVRAPTSCRRMPPLQSFTIACNLCVKHRFSGHALHASALCEQHQALELPSWPRTASARRGRQLAHRRTRPPFRCPSALPCRRASALVTPSSTIPHFLLSALGSRPGAVEIVERRKKKGPPGERQMLLSAAACRCRHPPRPTPCPAPSPLPLCSWASHVLRSRCAGSSGRRCIQSQGREHACLPRDAAAASASLHAACNRTQPFTLPSSCLQAAPSPVTLVGTPARQHSYLAL